MRQWTTSKRTTVEANNVLHKWQIKKRDEKVSHKTEVTRNIIPIYLLMYWCTAGVHREVLLTYNKTKLGPLVKCKVKIKNPRNNKLYRPQFQVVGLGLQGVFTGQPSKAIQYEKVLVLNCIVTLSILIKESNCFKHVTEKAKQTPRTYIQAKDVWRVKIALKNSLLPASCETTETQSAGQYNDTTYRGTEKPEEKRNLYTSGEKHRLGKQQCDLSDKTKC